MHSAARPGKPFLDPTNSWNNWKQTSWILSRLQPDRLTSADPMPAVHSLYVCQKGRTSCCNLSECQKDFDRALSRGCYRNWTLTGERESIITEWKLHFVFGTEQNGNWLLDLKSLAAGVSRWCIVFCNSILGRMKCQALQCWRAVQIGQNRKRMQRTQEAPE